MNKIKDFIYDKSDIVVALVILSIAGIIIFSRIDAILSYPASFAIDGESVINSLINEPADKTTSETAIVPDEKAEEDTQISEDDGENLEIYAVYINFGESLQSIADKFVSVGLFETTEDFFSAVDTADAGTQIKTGNFIIPSNATPEEVIQIIIKPGL